MTNQIIFKPGAGRSSKAVFQCGAAVVPAALISRLATEVEGKSEAAIVRALISKLEAKRPGKSSYKIFLDELERAGIGYLEAFQQMIAMKGKGRSASKAAEPRFRKEAESVAKTLCRKYSNLPAEEMFDKFAATVSREEFKGAVVALLKDYEKTYGRNAQQKIRVRKARPELQERAKKARLGRKR
jgi:hypothetical protein